MIKCPLGIREWLQTVSLSVPTGVKLFIAGGYPLSEYMGTWETKSIDIFLLGKEIIEDKLQIERNDDIWNDASLTFYGKLFEEGAYGSWDCIIDDGWELNIYLTNYSSISDIICGFDMDICRCFISELETTDWEVQTTISVENAINTKTVWCSDSEGVFENAGDYDLYERVARYKERLPEFKFVKEL